MESLLRQAKENSNTVGHLHATSEHGNDRSFILNVCGGGLSAHKSGKTTHSHVIFKYSCSVGNAMCSLSAAFSLNLDFLVFD